MFRLCSLFLIVILFLSGCDSGPEKVKNPDGTVTLRNYYPNRILKSEITKKDSLRQGISSYYDMKGKLYMKINYHNNLKEGWAYNYFTETGKVQTKVFYKEGLIDGEAYSYYSNGKLFKDIIYHMGNKHGMTKIYGENGKLQSECEYYNNLPGIGLKEYNSSGKPLDEPHIIIREINHLALDQKFILEFSLSDQSKVVKFYEDTLLFGRFLTPYMMELPARSGVAQMVIYKPYAGLFMKKLNIVAVRTTYRGNKQVLQRKYNLVIQD